MATKKKKTLKHTPQRITADQVTALLLGFCMDNAEYPSPNYPFVDEKHRESVYFLNRDYLVSLIGQGAQNDFFGEIPWGERPSAWWDFEHKEGHWIETDKGRFAIYGNSQFEYLKNHGLLFRGEEARVQDG